MTKLDSVSQSVKNANKMCFCALFRLIKLFLVCWFPRWCRNRRWV